MVTFAGPSDDAFNLELAVAGQVKEASIKGTQLVLRSLLGYASASRSAQGGEKAFKQATKFLVGNMLRSVARKLEIELLYGQVGYGVVASTVDPLVTIVTAEWAPGIWAGAEKMPIEFRSPAGTLRGVATEVTKVDFDTRSIEVALLPGTVVAGDIIWHKGAFGKEFAGLHKIITNTGELFGIDASEYSLWKGNTYSASNAVLSFGKIQDAIARAVEKGLDNDVVVMVNPKAWADLLTDQSALRMYDSSYKNSEMENGAKAIKFYGQNGMIEIVPSIFVKEGYAYVLSKEDMIRIGSTDVTFKRPSAQGEFFRDMENSAAYELRCYTDQALFINCPGKFTLITNIVNG